jgi:predicted NUDIX family NTP pyrophosphohydrolase
MRRSAALLAFRRTGGADPGADPEVLIGHMGGPFWARKDTAAWSIPKGEIDPDEDALQAARREFTEEIGLLPPDGQVIDLGHYRQTGGKVIFAFAVEGDVDLADFSSNLFELEWPPRSGQIKQFPELDRASWMSLDEAIQKLVKGQIPILEQLRKSLPARHQAGQNT